MIAKSKFIAPLLMAGAAAAWLGTAPMAVAESYSVATSSISSITVPLQPGGDGCANGTCGNGGPQGGGGCTAGGVCGNGGPQGGSGCNAAGVCGHGGPGGGGGCVPGVGCFNYGQ